MPKNKAKGSKVERELFMKFVENGFRAVRVAGSGMMENAECDIIAGKKGAGKYAVEVKSSKSTTRYIEKEQIEKFMIFSEIFGLNPVIALRFNREGFLFLHPKHLRDSGKCFAITLEEAKKKGKRFPQFFE